MGAKPVYIIDGARIKSLDGFFRAIGEAVDGPGGYFGRGIDGFDDCLYGGFGTPAEGFVIEWRNSEVSRDVLGYRATVRANRRMMLRELLSASREARKAVLIRARQDAVPTLFDVLVRVIRSHESRGVELRLL